MFPVYLVSVLFCQSLVNVFSSSLIKVTIRSTQFVPVDFALVWVTLLSALLFILLSILYVDRLLLVRRQLELWSSLVFLTHLRLAELASMFETY